MAPYLASLPPHQPCSGGEVVKQPLFALALVMASIAASACWIYAGALAGEPGSAWVLETIIGVKL